MLGVKVMDPFDALTPVALALGIDDVVLLVDVAEDDIGMTVGVCAALAE